MNYPKFSRRFPRSAVAGLFVLIGGLLISGVAQAQLSPTEALGRSIFFDQDLSINRNQACAACHDPAWGFTGPIEAINEAGAVYEGSIPGRFGNRKPPSAAYATLSPVLHYVVEKEHPGHGMGQGDDDEDDVLFIGGNFWDGRATGEKLGNPAADQAQGPFLNPLEQGLPDNACVVHRVCMASYPTGLEDVFPGACDIAWPPDVEAQCAMEGGAVALSEDDRADVDAAYDWIALAIADYEDSAEVNSFTSKYDAFLRGEVRLSKLEKKGLALFRGKGRCDNCHLLDEGPDGGPPLFTDFTYDNLGVPRNPDNPFYTEPAFNPAGEDWIDTGLGGFLASRPDYADYAEDNLGKQKVPSLRNVAARPFPGADKAFMHNGYFKSLKAVVHFYNTRDVKPPCPDRFTTEADAREMNCWPAPEVPQNVNTEELGNLHMTSDQEDAVVAFLGTLSDGWTP
jgi:cytochrome c peroxidase